jgi:hypothetical protein
MTIRSLNRNTNLAKRITRSRTASDLTRRRSIKQVIAGEGKPDFYIKWMIVGGGGAGGAGQGCGGGGGGIVIGINYLSPTGNLSYGVNYPIGIGGGGGYVTFNRGGNGGDSSFLGFTALGGGGGGSGAGLAPAPFPGANTTWGRSGGGSGGNLVGYVDYLGRGSQGGTGGVLFPIDYNYPYIFPGNQGSKNDFQDGTGDRSGKNGNDETWFETDPTRNRSTSLNPAYPAPGPLVARGYGGGGGGCAGFAGGSDFGMVNSTASTEEGSAAGQGGDGGDGYAFNYQTNFLQGPIADRIWGLGYGGGGSSYGYQHDMRDGYYGPTPSVFPNAPGGVKTGFGAIRDAGDSWTGSPNWSPNGEGIGYNPSRGNPGEPWHNGPAGGFPPAGNSFRPYGWKSGYGEDVSPGGPAPLPFSTPAGYFSMNGLPNSGQGGGGRWNTSSYYQWGCRGPFWGTDADNPGAPNWLGRAGANTGGRGGSGVVFLSYPQVFGNCTNTGSPDVYVTTDGFRVYTFRNSGSITIDYDPN